MTTEKIEIGSGAEARIFEISDKVLEKVRPEKKYRISQIDLKLRKSRTKSEFKVLTFAFENGLNVPKPFEINLKNFSFTFEKIIGKSLMESLTKDLLFKSIFQIIKLHKIGIVHSDLTTLNMLFDQNNKVYLIDFGLSSFSKRNEDRAVDLNLFLNCIKNEHLEFFYLKEEILNIYKTEMPEGKLIIERLKYIELRGRNK